MAVVIDEIDSILIDQALTSYIMVKDRDELSNRQLVEIMACSLAASKLDISMTETIYGKVKAKRGAHVPGRTVGTFDEANGNVSIDKDETKRKEVLQMLNSELSTNELKQAVREQCEKTGRKITEDELDKIISQVREDVSKQESEVKDDDMTGEDSYLGMMQDALTAQHAHVKGYQYQVRTGEVILTQQNTGVNSEGQRLRGNNMASLHQFLEAKEGLIVRGEGKSSSEITAKELFVDIFIKPVA